MPLTAIEAEVRAALAAHLQTGRRVVLGYSGGVDSELLAFLLSKLQPEFPHNSFLLVHVHHGLSQFADHWAAHCQRRAEHYKIPIVIESVKVESGPRISIEAAARSARYGAFARHLDDGDLLLTAQHQDDQVETLLLALKRGSGPQGLAAMPKSKPWRQGTHLRPLLSITRSQIEQAARLAELSHIEDDSNDDLRFDRNFLRHQVVPELNRRWPGFSSSAARSAELCGEQQQLCDELAQLDLAKLEVSGALNLNALSALSSSRQHNVVRYWLRKNQVTAPSRAKMTQMKQFWQARTDAQPELMLEAAILRRYQDCLYLIHLPEPNGLQGEVETIDDLTQPRLLANGEAWQFLEAEQGLRVRMPTMQERVSVRYGLPGRLKVSPSYRNGSRELKKVWHELGVPPWRRSQVAMLFYDDELIAALGYWACDKALVNQGVGLRIEQ